MDYELLLINVAREQSGDMSCFRDNIGQHLLATYLKAHDFKAKVYSGGVADCKSIIIEEIVKKQVPIVGFYAAADNMCVVRNTIKWLSTAYPHIITVLGGPQAPVCDQTFFRETGLHFAIVGEGEIPMYQLLCHCIDESIPLSQVPNLVYWDAESATLISQLDSTAVITDLDTIGYPKNENSLSKNFRSGTMVGILTGRGCPFGCAFCYEGANAKNVRYRSIPNVMEEIDYIRAHNSKLEYINVYDDTFTLNQERVFAFCQEMKQRNLYWFCEGHISNFYKHPDLIKTMVDGGLHCIQFGIESGSQQVLDAYGKKITPAMMIEVVRHCKKAGIHGITGNFIIGGAHESLETLEASKQLAKALLEVGRGIIELHTVYFAPYPNTAMVNHPERYGITIDPEAMDYTLTTMRTAVVSTNQLSTHEIRQQKKQFDEWLRTEYEYQVRRSTKYDVLQCMYHDEICLHVNPTWQGLYLRETYIKTFLNHRSSLEQTYAKTMYPIRTFDEFEWLDGILVAEMGSFSGYEAAFLCHATGAYTAEELAVHIGCTQAELEFIFHTLNERCLVYMSEF